MYRVPTEELHTNTHPLSLNKVSYPKAESEMFRIRYEFLNFFVLFLTSGAILERKTE